MRKGSARVRKIKPDAIYSNVLVTKLINRSMKDGKKSVAEREVYKAFDLIAQKTKKEPVEVFLQALVNIKPIMEIRPRRIGGAAYQVPVPVKGRRQESLSIRWLVDSARAHSNSEFRTFAEKLAAEIIDATNKEGLAIKKKVDVERMAEANRAFAHFRW